MVDLSSYSNDGYDPGRTPLVRFLWMTMGQAILQSTILFPSSLKTALLRTFGSTIGVGVVIKPNVRVKYPWKLTIGDHSWVGESCWIDNLAPVSIGSNVCVSQEAYICTGNHDWKDPGFGLIVERVTLADGSWVGAKSIVLPGVTIGHCAVAMAGSLIAKSIPDFEIHGGNPAAFMKLRTFKTSAVVEASSK